MGLIRDGKAPIVEEGIQELMAASVASGNVTVTSDTCASVVDCDVAFVCVGTPSLKNGSQDLTAIERVCEEIGQGLRESRGYPVVVIRSTVEPNSTLGLIAPILEKESGKVIGEDFGLCFQPEFLREGSSISDYDNPPFTVVGGDSDRSIDRVREVFEALPCDFIGTDIGTAEMLKYACNNFHALKIGFANEIGRVAKALEVDSRKVMELVCKDTQLNISPVYLRPGFAFGGSCLPKDLRALVHLAKTSDVEIPMLGALLDSNDVHVRGAVDKVLDDGRRNVALLGLSFKTGTDDLRESPLVTLAEALIGKGMSLEIYDPQVSLARLIGANKRYIESTIPHISSLLRDDVGLMISTADIIVIGLVNPEIEKALREYNRPNQKILDLVGLPNSTQLAGSYDGICW
jgi:GDP-mannose 6-dehydrogenase